MQIESVATVQFIDKKFFVMSRPFVWCFLFWSADQNAIVFAIFDVLFFLFDLANKEYIDAMAVSAISQEEFQRLQNQLLDLRSANYTLMEESNRYKNGIF